MAKVNFDDYVPVAERLGTLRERWPDATLQPVDPTRPYRVETIGEHTFIVYAAACYRHPDDPRPGIGVAWEPFPGRTNFTRDSELMNAETSAWGRAIVAALAADTNRGIASREDVRARQEPPTDRPNPLQPLLDSVQSLVVTLNDPTPWESFKSTHRGWHKSETGLLEARDALFELLAAEGAEPFLVDEQEQAP